MADNQKIFDPKNIKFRKSSEYPRDFDLEIPEFRYRRRSQVITKQPRRFTTTRSIAFETTNDLMDHLRYSRQFGVLEFSASRAGLGTQRWSGHSSAVSMMPKSSSVSDKKKESIGKKVQFQSLLDVVNKKSSYQSSYWEILSKQSSETTVSLRQVKKSLAQKLTSEELGSENSFERALLGFKESATPEPDKESSVSENESSVCTEIPTACFTGFLRVGGGSHLSSKTFRKAKVDQGQGFQSRRATIHATDSYLMNDDTWPWPWLDPKVNAIDIFALTSATRVTYARQGELAQAKIPLLATSLKRYLESLEPQLPPSRLSEVKKAAEEFALGDGSEFHNQLFEKSKDTTNWHKTALPNYSYLLSRQEQCLQNIPIVLPFFDDLWPASDGSQIKRATAIITFSLQFWSLLRKEQLNPRLDENNELVCMHSFRKLFSSYRVPGIPCDGVSTAFKNEREFVSPPKHIIVIHKGFIFAMDVIDSKLAILSEDIISGKLEGILEAVKKEKYEENQGIGALTSANRNMWCLARESLLAISTQNQANLQLIEEALFLVSLDHYNASYSKLGQEAIFADACNRWYDIGLSFYIYTNGLITVNVNRSLQDGMPAAVLIQYIHESILNHTEKWDDDLAVSAYVLTTMNNLKLLDYNDVFEEDRESIISDLLSTKDFEWTKQADEHGLHMLQFDIDDEIKDDIEQSSMAFQALERSLSMADCSYSLFVNDVVEVNKIHPDAFAHLIMQVTFFRMYFRLASIGTRVPLKSVYHGRTDVMISSTKEILQWCKLMLSPDSSKAEQVKAFWAAEKKHRAIYNQVVGGGGPFNHFHALGIIGEEISGDTPAFFQHKLDPFSGNIENFDIFAETLGSCFVGRCVVLPNHSAGYGVGYSIHKSKIGFYVTSWSDEPTTSAELYASSLRKTLELHHEFFQFLGND